jgi:hypothetical protein
MAVVEEGEEGEGECQWLPAEMEVDGADDRIDV